ncbi:hypothetical protein SADUNF_Sadunf13G0069600 [Salix dunnii]|uniref:Uncharacterized protein n=1 Tax=Salix dunnii TaxID=1413687 RepID=A0A835MNE6_9ROSI|nr:hypothetical protein SADUNF_Sadunf13G0069600 [Salix dunnii]
MQDPELGLVCLYPSQCYLHKSTSAANEQRGSSSEALLVKSLSSREDLLKLGRIVVSSYTYLASTTKYQKNNDISQLFTLLDPAVARFKKEYVISSYVNGIIDAFNSGIWYAWANEFPKLGDNVEATRELEG